MKLTNKGLVEYVKSVEGMKTVYMWGSFGQRVTDSFIQQKVKQYPRNYTPQKVRKLENMVGQNVYALDCVGLIKSYMWGGIGSLKYNSSQDITANMMYQRAKVKGNISTLDKSKTGQLVHMSGHVGVHIGNGNVIEATPSWADGVQKTVLSQRKWTAWYECPFISYIDKVDNVNKVEEVNEVSEIVIYKTLNDIPSWGKATVTKLLALNALSKDSINLTHDMLRLLVINDRVGIYDK